MKIRAYITVSVLLAFAMAGCSIGPGIEPLEGGSDGIPDGPVVLAPVLSLSTGDGIIRLAWDSTGDSFTVFRDGGELAAASTTDYDDAGVVNGTRYCYIVRAHDASGASADSNQRCGTPLGGIPATSMSVMNHSLSATISWAAITGAAAYNLYALPVIMPDVSKSMYKAAVNEGTLLAEGITDLFYEWTELSNNCIIYPVLVVPVDSDGNETAAESGSIEAQPDTEGVLDPTFGVDGAVIHAVNGSIFTDVDVIGEVIVALVSNNGVMGRGVIAYDDDGLELWSIDLTPEFTRTNALAVDDADRIVVVGWWSDTGDVMVCRLAPAGDAYAFDSTFGTAGCTALSGPGVSNDNGVELAIDREGRILVVGYAAYVGPDDTKLALWRVMEDGSLDTSFSAGDGTDGVYIYTTVGTEDRGTGVAIADDGSIYVSSPTYTTPSYNVLNVIRLDPNGDADGGGSIAALSLPSNSVGNILRSSSGDVIGVSASNVAGLGFVLHIFSSVPLYDSSVPFDYDPMVSESVAKMTFDCHERVLIAGKDTGGVMVGDALVLRTNEFYGLDTDFGIGGWFEFDYIEDDAAWGIAIDGLGRILVGGYGMSGGQSRALLFRLK